MIICKLMAFDLGSVVTDPRPPGFELTISFFRDNFWYAVNTDTNSRVS